MAKHGKLVIITGPMFAGKTTKLLKEIQKARKGNKKAVLFKSGIDNRYSELDVVTHDGVKLPAFVLPEGEQCIKLLDEAAKEYDIIGIDEGQFWENTIGLAEKLNQLAFNSKTVYVSMLNRKSDGEPFEVSKELIPRADKVHTLESKCWKCGRKATFTQRLIPDPKVKTMAAFVGGAKEYQPICRSCFSKVHRAKGKK